MKVFVIIIILTVLFVLIYALVKASGMASREEERHYELLIPMKNGKTENFYKDYEDDEDE